MKKILAGIFSLCGCFYAIGGHAENMCCAPEDQCGDVCCPTRGCNEAATACAEVDPCEAGLDGYGWGDSGKCEACSYGIDNGYCLTVNYCINVLGYTNGWGWRNANGDSGGYCCPLMGHGVIEQDTTLCVPCEYGYDGFCVSFDCGGGQCFNGTSCIVPGSGYCSTDSGSCAATGKPTGYCAHWDTGYCHNIGPDYCLNGSDGSSCIPVGPNNINGGADYIIIPAGNEGVCCFIHFKGERWSCLDKDGYCVDGFADSSSLNCCDVGNGYCLNDTNHCVEGEAGEDGHCVSGCGYGYCMNEFGYCVSGYADGYGYCAQETFAVYDGHGVAGVEYYPCDSTQIIGGSSSSYYAENGYTSESQCKSCGSGYGRIWYDNWGVSSYCALNLNCGSGTYQILNECADCSTDADSLSGPVLISEGMKCATKEVGTGFCLSDNSCHSCTSESFPKAVQMISEKDGYLGAYGVYYYGVGNCKKGRKIVQDGGYSYSIMITCPGAHHRAENGLDCVQ